MTPRRLVRVPDREIPVRLDAFLETLTPSVPKRQLRLALRGSVVVDGRTGKKGTLLFGGEQILLPRFCLANPSVIPNPDLGVAIIYEDEHLIAVNKPAGLPCHPISSSETRTVANFLVAHEPSCASAGGSLEAGLVHRLDNETSGLLLAAKKKETYCKLRQAFSSGRVFKKYLALCVGQLQEDMSIVLPLARSRTTRRKMIAVDPSSRKLRKCWEARTQVRVLEVYASHTLVSVEISTGVTHQIRVHMWSIGHPLAGEDLYAESSSRTDSLGLKRHFLHAVQLEFIHPVLGSPVRLECALPDDLKTAMHGLEPLKRKPPLEESEISIRLTPIRR